MHALAVDLMGSDAPPEQLLSGALDVCSSFNRVYFLATADIIEQHQRPLPTCAEWLEVEEVVEMNDPPLCAARRKPKSSLSLGLNLLKRGEVSAYLTAGNTGALVAAATLTLPMLPSIDRAGLLAVIPTRKAPLAVMDVGGGVSFKASHLRQFAQIACNYQKIALGKEKPVAALLNIGKEPDKGTSEHRKAYRMLCDGPFCFAGNIEAKEVLLGEIDVLVTDGFSGNIFLKTLEGSLSFVHERLGQPRGESGGGALLLGFEGLILKCHGIGSALSLKQAMEQASCLLRENFLFQLRELQAASAAQRPCRV